MIKNPIITGFNPDPSILRHGDAYYIAVSSFEWMPGIPIYKSKDLKNWELINHAIKSDNENVLSGIGSALGVWAPNLTFCRKTNKFYICYSMVYGAENNNFDVDNFVIESDDISGDWSEPKYLNSSGFDPAMFHEEDGKTWVMNLEWDFRQGYEHPGQIVIEEYDHETKKLVSGSVGISRGATDRGCLEGPSMYKKNGYYYLVTAEGGTGYGHCVCVSRAKNILGPYEGYAGNPIITSQPEDFNERGVEESAKPHRYNPKSNLQKSGHGNIVETLGGEVYMTHLCSRPLEGTLRSVLGRETAIQKCIWTDDLWIKLDSKDNLALHDVKEPGIEDITPFKRAEKDMFTGELPIDYYSPRQAADKSWVRVADGRMSLTGRQSLFSQYNVSLICRKAKSFKYAAHTFMKFDPDNFMEMSGLVNYYNNKNFYYLRLYHSQSLGGLCLGIEKADKGKKYEYLESRVRDDAFKNGVYLKCEADGESLQYYYALKENAWEKIGGKLDLSILSDEYAGGFTGSFVGVTVQDMYKRRKTAEFEYFYYNDK